MRVITIKQPWATLIIKGYKEYEFRGWKTKYRGEILIHAGKGIDKEAIKRFEYLNLTYPKGCIIGKCTITDCVLVDESLSEYLYNKDNIVYKSLKNKGKTDFKYNYGFKIENVTEIEPIYINGKLSIWNVNDNLIK